MTSRSSAPASAGHSDPASAHDRIADTFDAVMNQYDVSRRIDVLVDEFLRGSDLTGRLVLDGGCGTGRFSGALKKRGARVIALDYGPRLAQLTKLRHGVSAVNGTLMQLPFADGTFDVVLSSEVIEHTPAPQAAAAELCRVVAPGGHLVLSTPNKLWQAPVRLASLARMRPYDGYENFLWPSELSHAVAAAGLTVVEHRGIHAFPFQITPAQGLLNALDRWGSALLPLMINQCVHAVRPISSK